MRLAGLRHAVRTGKLRLQSRRGVPYLRRSYNQQACSCLTEHGATGTPAAVVGSGAADETVEALLSAASDESWDLDDVISPDVGEVALASSRGASTVGRRAAADQNQAQGELEGQQGGDREYEEESNPYTAEDANVGWPSQPQPADVRGSPELEALLVASREAAESNGGQPPRVTLEALEALFPFPLDGFQRKAVQQLLAGNSVVVCAPTGAGKTAIAEAGAAAALARGQRVIYTTPLKALSNQKLLEARARFGPARCGLQTGDTSLNTEADVVIMTTEILRNIMYRTAETAGPNTATRDERLGDVGLVVLDEVHYLGDPWRGSVWEEVIINCPRHIQMLAMSATVKNPDDLGGWISREHGQCVTIKTRFRPVPLRWVFAYKVPSAPVDAPPPRGGRGSRDRPAPGRVVLADLLDGSGRGLNPRLTPKEFMKEEARQMLARGRDITDAAGVSDFERQLERLVRKEAMLRRIMTKRIPTREAVVARLKAADMLPAIWFILSRKDCDVAALQSTLVLTSPAEQEAVRAEVAALRADQPDAVRERFVPALIRGAAAHHAGCLPGWKALVERCFQRGYVKLVYATGTLAAGINMPARTTIISGLGRRTDDGIQALPHNELLQMAGRAGRRGYDTSGNCVIVQGRFEGAPEAVRIITAGPEPLTSQFSTSYGLVLNLLSCYSLDEARDFLARSFGHYLSGEGNARRKQQVEQLTARAAELVAEYKEVADTAGDIKQLTATIKEERQVLQVLRAQMLEQRRRQVETEVGALPAPQLLMLNLSRQQSDTPQLLPALILGEVPEPPLGRGPSSANTAKRDACSPPFYFCLAADNRLMVCSAVHVVGLCRDPDVLASMADMAAELGPDTISRWAAAGTASWANLSAGQFSCQITPSSPATAVLALAISRAFSTCAPLETDTQLAMAVREQRSKVKSTLKQLEEAKKAAGSGGSSSSTADDALLQAKRLLRRAARLRTEMESAMQSTWLSFMDVLGILVDMGAMEAGSLDLLPLGLVARNLQAQNELWMALALTHPGVARLSGPQLAAFVGALICSEVIKRPISVWSSYQVSPVVVDVITELEGRREALFEAQASANLGRWNEFLLVDLRLAGIVEAWADGGEWREIMADVSLDDGDIARLLARTSDMLRQVVYNDHMLPYLKDTARAALAGMDRKPVSDLVV